MNLSRIKGMSLALVFKKIDDLGVANSMKENYQEPRGKMQLSGQLGDKTLDLRSKTKDRTLKYENQQKNSKDRQK